MGARAARGVAMVAAVVMAVGCGSTAAPSQAGPSTLASASTAPTPTATSPAPSALPASNSPSPSAGTGCERLGPIHHDAPDLEALLPERVGHRTLYRWSVRGRCFLDLAWTGSALGVDGVLESADTIEPDHDLDIDHLAIAVAGRDDPTTDPPYFVWALSKPASEEERILAMSMLFGGASFVDISSGIDVSNYQAGTVGGKEVSIGTKAMIEQDEHERGVPYLYETDDVLFLIVADDASWAAEAVKKLP